MFMPPNSYDEMLTPTGDDLSSWAFGWGSSCASGALMNKISASEKAPGRSLPPSAGSGEKENPQPRRALTQPCGTLILGVSLQDGEQQISVVYKYSVRGSSLQQPKWVETEAEL